MKSEAFHGAGHKIATWKTTCLSPFLVHLDDVVLKLVEGGCGKSVAFGTPVGL